MYMLTGKEECVSNMSYLTKTNISELLLSYYLTLEMSNSEMHRS